MFFFLILVLSSFSKFIYFMYFIFVKILILKVGEEVFIFRVYGLLICFKLVINWLYFSEWFQVIIVLVKVFCEGLVILLRVNGFGYYDKLKG